LILRYFFSVNRSMARVLRWLTLAMLTSLAATSALSAQNTQASSAADSHALVLAGHPSLAASLERIAKGSALWRSEIEALRPTGRLAVVVASRQVLAADPRRGIQRAADTAVLADISLLPGTRSGIAAVVVVDLQLLDELHDRRGSSPAEKAADLDRILVHEVYGHAFPYLRVGNASGKCADPVAGERAEQACSILRENAVRAELGLGRRTEYGLRGLALGRLSLDQVKAAVNRRN
jgi:hypothetical protein